VTKGNGCIRVLGFVGGGEGIITYEGGKRVQMSGKSLKGLINSRAEKEGGSCIKGHGEIKGSVNRGTFKRHW